MRAEPTGVGWLIAGIHATSIAGLGDVSYATLAPKASVMSLIAVCSASLTS